MDLKATMMRKAGPMPVWAWTALAASFIVGIMMFKKKGIAVPTDTGKGTGESADEFQSAQSQTVTDPVTGNQTTTQYSASGPNSFLPGGLTRASPMPYQSSGDVYVNVPGGESNAQTTSLLRTPVPEEVQTSRVPGHPWITTTAQTGETWQDVVARVYNFAPNYKAVTDPGQQASINGTVVYMKEYNRDSPGYSDTGPLPGQVLFYR
jgi:hypothetical protein